MTESPNIVWVTLESTRADATSVCGSGTTTPNLRRIGDSSDGQHFSACFSHGVWTLPSSASILTGSYPTRHGAGMASETIPDSIRTIPETLQDVGYTTACLSPNSHLSSATGLDRGFDRFAWVGTSTLLDTVGLRTLLKYALNVRRHGGGLTLESRRHHRGYMLNDLAKRWVRSFRGGDEPFFLYLHHPGPHHPYTPPRRYLAELAADLPVTADRAIDVALDHHDNFLEYIARGLPLDEQQLAIVERLYEAEVAYADELVGDLFDYVREQTTRETIFVVTADHGELFGEDGLLAHMITVDDAVCHVPLIVHGLDVSAPSDTIVQHADVMRTILSTVGADSDDVQGVEIGEREYAVVQRGAKRARRNLSKFAEIEPGFDASRYHETTVTALRTDSHKYVYSEDGQALYELPDETTDVASDDPDLTARFRADVEALLANEAAPVGADAREGEFTDAMRSQLADLGYLVE